MWTVRVSRSFSAAHFISGEGSKCEKMHGHNYRVEVAVSSQTLQPGGMVVDFVELRSRLESVLPDHRLLNEVYGFIPTAENLARHFYEELVKFYPVSKVTVWENEECCAEFVPD